MKLPAHRNMYSVTVRGQWYRTVRCEQSTIKEADLVNSAGKNQLTDGREPEDRVTLMVLAVYSIQGNIFTFVNRLLLLLVCELNKTQFNLLHSSGNYVYHPIQRATCSFLYTVHLPPLFDFYPQQG